MISLKTLVEYRPRRSDLAPATYQRCGHLDKYQFIIFADFWRKQGHKFEIDPLLVKVIIAKESSFNPKARPHYRNNTARGLKQVLGHTIDAGELAALSLSFASLPKSSPSPRF